MAPKLSTMKDDPSVNTSFSSSMMEHHIPASLLDASKGFSTIVGSDGTQFIFSIGDDDIFRASADCDDGCSSWTILDIGSYLLTTPDILNGKVKDFVVSYDPENMNITIVVVVTTTCDKVYVAHGLAANSGASWLSDDGAKLIKWQPVPFDSSAFDTITKDNLNVFRICFLMSMKSEIAEEPLAYVEVLDPSNADHKLFNMIVPPATVSQNAWNVFITPFDTTKALEIAGGQPWPKFAQGIYILGQGTDEKNPQCTLDFLPADTSHAPFSYPVAQDASAIASLVLPDQSTQTTTTELYVASENTLTIMHSGNVPSATTVAINSDIPGYSYITGTTVLHVSTNFGEKNVKPADALVNIFGLNSKGQIFYTHAPYEDRLDQVSSWAPVVVLIDQVQSVAPVVNSTIGTLGFLATTTSPSVIGSAKYVSTASMALVSMTSDPVSFTWGQRFLPVPFTDDYILQRSYTSKLLVTDPNTNLPKPAAKLQISTTANATFLVNGLSTTCVANQPTPITTDSSGCVSICNAVSGIQGVRFTILDSDGQQPVNLKLDGNTITQPYDPASTIQSTLTSGIKGDLTKLTYQGPQGNAIPVVDNSSPNLDTASQTFKDINANTPSKRADSIANDRGNTLTARVRVAKRRHAARKAALEIAETGHSGEPTGLFDGIEMFFADLAQWIVSAAKDVAKVVVQVVEDTVALVVHFAEATFHAVMETLEDAWNSIVSVFKWIGAEFEKIFSWLAFLFDWHEMVQVHNGLSAAVSSIISNMPSQLQVLNSRLDNLITAADGRIGGDNLISSMSSSLQGSVSSNGSTSSTNSTMTTNPHVGWVKDQLGNTKNAALASTRHKSTVRFVHPTSKPLRDDSTFASSLASIWSKLPMDGHETSLNSLQQSANGSAGGSTLWPAIQDLGKAILNAIQADLDAAFQATGTLMDDANAALKAEIHIPVLSAIYNDLVGNPPSILDITCLCIAIISTIGYNIVRTNNDSLEPLSSYVSSSGFQNLFNPSFSLKSELNQVVKPARPSLLKESSSTAADAILGGLQVLKGFALLVAFLGEDSEASKFTTIGTIVDNMCNVIGGCIGAGLVDDPDYADFIIVGVGMRSLTLFAIAQSVRGTSGLAGEEAKAICILSEMVSSILGTCSLIEICAGDAQHTSAEDWLDCLGDFAAFIGTFFAMIKQPEIAGVISVLRTFAAEGVGICFFSDAAETNRSKAKPLRLLELQRPRGQEDTDLPVWYRQRHPRRVLTDDTGPPDATTLPLTLLDMAFVIDEKMANQIADNAASPDSVTVDFSWDATFNESSDPVCKCQGTLVPMSDSAPYLSCGAAGDDVGNGVLWNFIIQGATAVVNGNTYPGTGTETWTVPLIVGSYQKIDQSIGSSQTSPAYDHQRLMKDTYKEDTVVCNWGLDLGLVSLPNPVSQCPSDWQQSDWEMFCNAICHFITINKTQLGPNAQLSLIDGVVPSTASSNPQWNLGPTSYTYFNLPAFSADYQGAVVFGFMVSGNPLPSSPTLDFKGAALFKADSADPTQPNGLMFVSYNLITSAIKASVCTQTFMQTITGIQMTTTQTDDGTQNFLWIQNTPITDDPRTYYEPPDSWVWHVKAMPSSNAMYNDKSIHIDSICDSALSFDTLENGYYQQLAFYSWIAPSCFMYGYNVSSNRLPLANYGIGVKATLGISGNIVSYTYDESSQSFPSDPLDGGTAADWWNAPQGDPIDSVCKYIKNDNTDHPRVGPLSSNAVLEQNTGFCRPSNTQSNQVNIFAFPGKKTYQSASIGVNVYSNLVVRLTYVIT